MAATPMTTEQLLAMPDDDMERWLIRGQLREKPMIYRNRWHSRTMARISHLLEDWRQNQPKPRGLVLGGGAGVRLRRDPDSTFGGDVVYISAALAARQPDDTMITDGVPVLAVEILSPDDTLEEISEKIDEYLSAGFPMVWIVDPHDRTVTIYRPDQEPETVNARQELSGEPHLPGFCTAVAELFA